MFAADARKHTPGKNAEKENFSMRILVCDDCSFAKKQKTD